MTALLLLLLLSLLLLHSLLFLHLLEIHVDDLSTPKPKSVLPTQLPQVHVDVLYILFIHQQVLQHVQLARRHAEHAGVAVRHVRLGRVLVLLAAVFLGGPRARRVLLRCGRGLLRVNRGGLRGLALGLVPLELANEGVQDAAGAALVRARESVEEAGVVGELWLNS